MKLASRLLSMLLALALVFGMLPTAAYAEETEAAPETTPEDVEETIPETVPETIPETVPEAEPEAIEETIFQAEPEGVTETDVRTGVIPFRVNSLYEGILTAEDFDIPEFSDSDPERIDTHATNYLSIEAAGKEIRKHMKNRTQTFTIHVYADTFNEEIVGDAMVAVALEHTGNATEGDYLMWQFGGWGAETTSRYNSNKERFELTFKFVFAYYTTAAQEKQVTSEVNKLINTLGIRKSPIMRKSARCTNGSAPMSPTITPIWKMKPIYSSTLPMRH